MTSSSPDQTELQYNVRLVLIWTFPPHVHPPLLLLFFFFFLFFRESGRRKQEVAGLCLIPFLNSAPQLLWLDTGAGVCLRLYRFPPSHPGPPFLSAHLLSLSAFPLENPARGIYREDNVQRSSPHSFHISDFYFYFYFFASLANTVEDSDFSKRWVFNLFILQKKKESLLWMHFYSFLKLGGVTAKLLESSPGLQLSAGLQSFCS